MKLLIATRVSVGSSAPQFPGPSGLSIYGLQVHQFSDGSKLYVALIEVEAAFEITDSLSA